MKNLIKYIKIAKYGLQFRTLTLMSFVFIGLGVLFEMTLSFNNVFGMSLGGLYMGLVGAYTYQMTTTPAIAKLVNASPLKKDLLTKAPVLLSLAISMVSFTIFLVLRMVYTIGVRLPKEAEYYPEVNAEALLYMSILSCALLIFVLLIYLPISFKYYALGLVFLGSYLVVMLVFGNGMAVENFLADKYTAMISSFGYNATRTLIIAASYVIIVLGACVGYLVNLLTLRREISPFSYRYAIKQAAAK